MFRLSCALPLPPAARHLLQRGVSEERSTSSIALNGSDGDDLAMATVQSDIFKPTKYGGKYTVTLIPGMLDF